MKNIHAILEERERVNTLIRGFFRARGSVEAETPIVVRSPGMEPNLSPFETRMETADGRVFPAGLITSPEYSMKKLLGLGVERTFTLTRVFRNGEPLDETHNPEFTMLEWYGQGMTLEDGMAETEALVREVCQAFGRDLPVFRRARIRDLFLEMVGIDLDVAGATELQASCVAHGIHTDLSDTESDLYYRLFLSLIEPHLGAQPVFVYDYPTHQAALAELTPDGRYGRRFELYIDGLELCNAFQELTQPEEQRARFLQEANERKALGKTVFPVDEELLRLLPSVRQPTFGNALGVDRLHMLAMGRKSISEVIAFPASELFS